MEWVEVKMKTMALCSTYNASEGGYIYPNWLGNIYDKGQEY